MDIKELENSIFETGLDKLSDVELENVKLSILSLPESDRDIILLKMLDNLYDYQEDAKIDLMKNKYVIEFFRDTRLKEESRRLLRLCRSER